MFGCNSLQHFATHFHCFAALSPPLWLSAGLCVPLWQSPYFCPLFFCRRFWPRYSDSCLSTSSPPPLYTHVIYCKHSTGTTVSPSHGCRNPTFCDTLRHFSPLCGSLMAAVVERAGRVGKEAGLPVPPPSSNRTGGFPASGLPAITQSEACVGHAIQSSPTSKGLAHAGVRRTKFPPEGGRIVDFGACRCRVRRSTTN